MKKIIHKADARGKADHGWLSTRFSFSFADWYDPARMGFGALRVLNDDRIAPMSGFPMHSHANFEIITIVEHGVITHEDSMGNRGQVRAGEVQVMSAGTGVTHSEFNKSSEPLELFQIWINPNDQNVTPRYDQKSFPRPIVNQWQTLVSATDATGSLMIHQRAQIARIFSEAGTATQYRIKYSGNGTYFFVVDGNIEIEDELLHNRDALGVWDTVSVSLKAKAATSVLAIEVPMVNG